MVPVAIANGRLDVPLTVPAVPARNGARLNLQGVAGSIAGLEVSNGIDLTLGW